MLMDNSGSVRHGTLQIHTQDGAVLDNAAVLRDGLRLALGIWLWRLELPEIGIQCDFLNAHWGQELLIDNCSHGGRMHCARVPPWLQQSAAQAGCADCSARPLTQQLQCYGQCVADLIAGTDLPTSPAECTENLVSVFRCLSVLLDLQPGQDPEDLDEFGLQPPGAECEWTGHCGNGIHGNLYCMDGVCTQMH